MGTNFYWRIDAVRSVTLPTGEEVDSGPDRDDPRIHIGKRSAAGLYCWDCDQTMNKEGRERIHYGPSAQYWPGGRIDPMNVAAMVQAHKNAQYERCPTCGKAETQTNGLSEGPVAVELGFAKPQSDRPTGVCGAASFSWAQDPEWVAAICQRQGDEQIIEDEYGRAMTGREFVDMLKANCPIQYTDMVGRAFS